MHVRTIFDIQETAPTLMLHLRGVSMPSLLAEMGVSELLDLKERRALLEGGGLLAKDVNLALAYILFHAVEPAMARLKMGAPEQLFEWHETIIQHIHDRLPAGDSAEAYLEEQKRMDRERRGVIARTEGIRDGYLEGREVLQSEAFALNERMIASLEELDDEADNFRGERVREMQETAERIKALHLEQEALTEELKILVGRAVGAGEKLDALEKSSWPSLDRAEKAIRGMRG